MTSRLLSPEQRAITTAYLEAMEARLLTLLDCTPDELTHVTNAKLPVAVRVRLLSFLPVVIAASGHGRLNAEERAFWIGNEVSQLQGKPSVPFPFERHRRLLITLLISGCQRRGEVQTPEERRERQLRSEEEAYRRRFGDEAYHSLIMQSGDVPRAEQTDQEAA